MSDINIIRAKIKLAELEARSKSSHKNDALLRSALETCIEAPKRLPDELEKIDEAIAEIKNNEILDSVAITRIRRLEFDKELIAWQVRRAAQEARRRLLHLNSINTPQKKKEEKEKCRKDTIYWFKNYAWTADPRNPLLWAVPFVLFDYQEEDVLEIEKYIYVLRQDRLTEKSRGVGVTWEIACLFIKYWALPQEGSSFQALVGSYKASEVDEIGNPATIFEKMRLQIRLLPSWMLPKKFNIDKHTPLRKIVNPERGCSIEGETANEEFGRSGRYTVILFDEFPSFELAEAAATASSQSSFCHLYVGTPKGKLNYFARLKYSGKIKVSTIHWKKHPLYDERWYEGEKLKMTPEMVAQELDINYDASQPGKVYPTYNELYHVITRSEFMAAVPGGRSAKGEFRIPQEWLCMWTQDWGASGEDEHPCITLYFAKANEGFRTKYGQDIGGCVFIFKEYIAPENPAPSNVATYLLRYEAEMEIEKQVIDRRVSHEQSAVMATYNDIHGMGVSKVKTNYTEGIAQVRDYLELYATHEPHPFREVTRRSLYPKLPPIMGRPHLFLVVEDNQGMLHYDHSLNRWLVTLPKDSEGLKRTREEFPVYHYNKTEAGKAVKKQRPYKLFDDAMDDIRYAANVFFPPLAGMTAKMKLETQLPLSLREVTIRAESPEEMGRSYIARMEYMREKKLLPSQQKQRAVSYRDKLYELAERQYANNYGRLRNT
jgi:hypothetical protein